MKESYKQGDSDSILVRVATLLVTHPRWEPYGAVKLVDGLAGESPASADRPVGTVVISGDGAGDPTVASPEGNVLDGWMRIWSAPTGGQAKQQVVAKRTVVKPRKPTPHQNRSVRITGMPKLSYGVEGQRLRRSTGYGQPKGSPWSKRTTCCERTSMKAQNQSWVA